MSKSNAGSAIELSEANIYDMLLTSKSFIKKSKKSDQIRATLFALGLLSIKNHTPMLDKQWVC